MGKLIITPKGIHLSGNPLVKESVLSLVSLKDSDIKYLTNEAVTVNNSIEGKTSRALRGVENKVLDFYEKNSLTDMSIEGKVIGCTLKNNKNLESFTLKSDCLVQFTSYNNPLLKSLSLNLMSEEPISIIDLNDCKSLSSLELIVPTLKNLKFQDLYKLESLSLEGFKSDYLFLNTFGSLKHLFLTNCSVKVLDLSNNPDLKEVVITDCNELERVCLKNVKLTREEFYVFAQNCLPSNSKDKLIELDSDLLMCTMSDDKLSCILVEKGWIIK